MIDPKNELEMCKNKVVDDQNSKYPFIFMRADGRIAPRQLRLV